VYNTFQLATKYIHYQLTASNGKGHGVHSPFVFQFISQVLNDKTEYPCYPAIEAKRKALLHNKTEIAVTDFGAGSGIINQKKRSVHKIAASSLKPAKYAQLLFRIVQYYKPATVLELGTSLGITTAYLSQGNAAAQVATCEGAPTIAGIAQQQFDALQIKNIQLFTGEFSTSLPRVIQQLNKIDFVFIDGNHRKAPTLLYFEQLLPFATAHTIFVFDDIFWSKEMEEAWLELKAHPAVTLSINLFFIGLIFINPSFKEKQHFNIRF
jgi:predicted O-methyltransferase YrrM